MLLHSIHFIVLMRIRSHQSCSNPKHGHNCQSFLLPHHLPIVRELVKTSPIMDSVQGMTVVTTTSTTARPSVFDIHFIQTGICTYLTKRDIRHRTLVSRGIHAAFSPRLWRNIAIVRQSALNKLRQLEYQSALTRHVPYVQSITTVFGDAWPLIYTQCEILRGDAPRIDAASDTQG